MAIEISSKMIGVAGGVIGIAYVKAYMTPSQCLMAVLAIFLIKSVVNATGAVFFYWLQGNYVKMVQVMAQHPHDPRVQWLGAGAIGPLSMTLSLCPAERSERARPAASTGRQ
eukprot:Tamp_26089.p1 GENE.Tamp_26089~~Tamp_26089.p1  ORF type:complete len:124 (+),score=19.94 Tamp_26089:38-373(+)